MAPRHPVPNIEYDDEQLHHLVGAMVGAIGAMVGPSRTRPVLTEVVCNDAIWDAWEAKWEEQLRMMTAVRDDMIDEFERRRS